MNVEIRDERFRDIVGEDVVVERLATGFDFTEGPVWNRAENHLIFSDMPGNIMRKWTPDGGIQDFRQPSNMANGNCYDRQGRLVTCEHATSRVTRTEPDGSITVMATHYDGKELNSPNDIIVKSDGSIYFTDPSFGRKEYYGVPRDTELDFRGVYRLDAESGDLILLASDFDQPNGLCFSADESLLFVNDTMKNHIRVFDVNAAGSVSNSRVWAEVTGDREGVPDGMKIDSQGNLCTTGPGGIHYFAPDATSLGIIYMPEGVANFTWGEDDLRSMFVTASSSLYRVRLIVPGTEAL
jgi:gluconolactonase